MKIKVRGSFISVLCLFFLWLSCIWGAEPRHDLAGLKNFAQVSETLYRGAQPEKEGFILLRGMGIRTVVNLRAEHDDRSLLKGLQFNYVHIPVNTWNITDESVIAFLKVIADPLLQPVFVHCQHGADRTGMMVAVYRIYVQGWKKPEAIEELKAFGFWDGWVNIKKFLRELDKEKLEKKVKTSTQQKIEYIQ